MLPNNVLLHAAAIRGLFNSQLLKKKRRIKGFITASPRMSVHRTFGNLRRPKRGLQRGARPRVSYLKRLVTILHRTYKSRKALVRHLELFLSG